jgi:hypothetical protein
VGRPTVLEERKEKAQFKLIRLMNKNEGRGANMKRERKIPLLLLFFVMTTVALAAGPNRIAYQGSLTDSGGAAIPDASYKMRFTIFDALTLGTQLWQETQTGVAVTGGLFSVELGAFTALPDDLFLNDDLFLEVEVDLDGNTIFESDEKYIPRQHILSPFLRTNADNLSTGSLTLTGSVGGGYQVNKGVVYIRPSGVTPGSNDTIVGIYNDSTSNPDGYDVMAFGEGGGFTVNGPLQGGCKYIPAGYSRIGNGAAAEADIDAAEDLLISGSLEVQGDVHWSSMTNYYNVLAADFAAEVDGYQYTQGSNALYKDPGAGTQTWRAAVHLPQGATVTAFKIWFYDNDAADLTVQLTRRNMDNTAPVLMAICNSSGTPGSSTGEDTSISNATVDNSLYSYYSAIVFPAADTSSNLVFYSALITYTTTGP